jgi:hypothetical protein
MICSSLYNHSKCMASYLRYVIAGDGHFRTLVLACSERQLLKMQFHTREGLSSCWKVLRRATGWSSPQMSILIGPMTWWYDDTWYYLILLDVSCHITTKLVFDFFVYHMGVPTKKKKFLRYLAVAVSSASSHTYHHHSPPFQHRILLTLGEFEPRHPDPSKLPWQRFTKGLLLKCRSIQPFLYLQTYPNISKPSEVRSQVLSQSEM